LSLICETSYSAYVLHQTYSWN